jgi:hypothetical protein
MREQANITFGFDIGKTVLDIYIIVYIGCIVRYWRNASTYRE